MSSFDLGEAFLAHYGVKGMHWGIRNKPIKPVIDVFPLKRTRQTAHMFMSAYKAYKMYNVVKGVAQKLAMINNFNQTNAPVWQSTLVSGIR